MKVVFLFEFLGWLITLNIKYKKKLFPPDFWIFHRGPVNLLHIVICQFFPHNTKQSWHKVTIAIKEGKGRNPYFTLVSKISFLSMKESEQYP